MEGDTPEDQLIFNAKVGNLPQIQSLLQLRAQQSISLNVNCKCKSKSSVILSSLLAPGGRPVCLQLGPRTLWGGRPCTWPATVDTRMLWRSC